MTRQETYEIVCVLLEDFFTREEVAAEEIAEAILHSLADRGDDLVDHLDPPFGLQRWLESHGLSLVETRQVTPPRVWAAIEDDEEEEPAQAQQVGPQVKVTDRVRFKTAPSGPQNQSYLGSGIVMAHLGTAIVVHDGFREVVLYPGEGDIVTVVPPS